LATVTFIQPSGKYPVQGGIPFLGAQEWTPTGRWWDDRQDNKRDLVSRIEDETQEPNPLITPLEWVLAQLEPSLDPDWQAAHAAALEALAKAKGGTK
jgi:hypothetical protein